jgi:hypothetical protein
VKLDRKRQKKFVGFYLYPETHEKLRKISAIESTPMGEVIIQLVDKQWEEGYEVQKVQVRKP